MLGSVAIPKLRPMPFAHSPSPLQQEDDKPASGLEALAIESLKRLGIGHTHNKFYFPIEIDGEQAAYTPDFVLELKHDGRQVLLETHRSSLFNVDDMNKLAAFMDSEYKQDYYLIIATVVKPRKPNKAKINMHLHGFNRQKIADEIWYMVDMHSDDLPYRGLTKPVCLGDQLDGLLTRLGAMDDLQPMRMPHGVELRTLAPQ